jgi:hypothetical protein
MERLVFKQAGRVPEISGMWRHVQADTSVGEFGITKRARFTGTQLQVVKFVSGDGRFGVENQGLNRWGMNFVEGRPYIVIRDLLVGLRGFYAAPASCFRGALFAPSKAGMTAVP